MTYRELLNLYKTGQLNEDKRREVEADIEKQDAISDYLYEESDIPELQALTENSESEDAGNQDSKYAALIQRSIRRAFVKMGFVVGLFVLVVVLGVIFVLPQAVSIFYYNPAEIVGKSESGGMETNRMSLDLSVYTELFCPGYYRNNVTVSSEGYGKYDLNIRQNASYNGRFTDISGRLDRGKLILYNTNILKEPVSNAFVFPESVKGQQNQFVDGITGADMGAAGTKDQAKETLSQLDENEWYVAYVSLADIMDYEDFYQWFEALSLSYGNLWCAVYTEDEDGYAGYYGRHIGVMPNAAGLCLDWDRKTYPKLCLLDNSDESDDWDQSGDASAMQTHFISLLRYMRDHSDILEMMGNQGAEFDSMIQNVEKDGLRLYGFAVGVQKKDILKLSEDENVTYIYTTIQQ